MDEEIELFAREQLPQLLRTAYLLTGRQQDAEDLVQDTLVKVWTHWRKVSASREPDKYVNRVLINLFIDTKRRRRLVLVEFDDQESRLPRASNESDAVDLREILAQALLELGPRERAAVVLRHYRYMEFNEIAACMGVGESTVRATLSRAMKNLRTAMTSLNRFQEEWHE